MIFNRCLDGYYDVENQLPSYMSKMAAEYFEREDREKKSIQTKEQFEERRRHIREYFIDAIGGLDIPKTPLNPMCTGEIDKGKYKIEKIIFESQPGVYVTSNLYRPAKIAGKAPGILFACGHAYEAKAGLAYQKVCIDLALNGFIVLAVDPTGQGERMQYYNKGTGKIEVGWGTTEHSYGGLQCNLTGSSIARYFIWDLIRGLDYLESLPDVDPDRLGITGNSGGGTQTSYMMLMDERLKVAVPCCYITSREEYMKTGQAHDSEQNIYGAIVEGINNDDFISAFAPKPALIGAVESDFFCVEGTLASYARAKHVYSLYDSIDNISLCLVEGVHGYNDGLRQGAVNWFLRHLKGEDREFVTDLELLETLICEPEELWCTKKGQVKAEFDDVRTIFEMNKEYFNENRYSPIEDIDMLRQRMDRVLNMPKEKSNIYPRIICTEQVDDIEVSKIFFPSQRDIMVSGLYMSKQEDSHNCTILVLDGGTNSVGEEQHLIDKLLDRGDVFVFDPRGVGAVKSRNINSRDYSDIYGTEYKLNSDAIMMKTSLTALRTYDVIRAYDFINLKYPDMKVSFAGKGISALYTLFATVYIDAIDKVYLMDMIDSFEDLINTEFYDFNIGYEIYGILKEFDIPEIICVLETKIDRSL